MLRSTSDLDRETIEMLRALLIDGWTSPLLTQMCGQSDCRQYSHKLAWR